MPDGKPSMIPGKEGTDYHFVNYGGVVYVVYRVKLPNGKYVNTSWRVEKGDYDALGVDPSKANRIGKAQFQSLNVFGSASEIARGNRDEHPFQQYLKDLRERYGHVSWISNKEFMSVMLMGWAENWTAAELEQRMKQTKWYQSRTDSRRQWELEMTKEERQQKLKSAQAMVVQGLDDLYGPNADYSKQFGGAKIKAIAMKIASGVWGDPSEGMQTWLQSARRAAERVEGSQAWIDRQKTIEEQRGFMNRPEDVAEKIRQEAAEWLGPRGVPDKATIRRWSEDLVSEKASDADWQTYLQQQAKNLYPWLGPNERWQDRASSYKKIIEDNWGRPVGWDNKLLYELGDQNASGELTGKALSYDQFERVVRSKPAFWEGPVARDEGFQLFNELNNVFNGVGA